MKGLHITADLHFCSPQVPDIFTNLLYLSGVVNISAKCNGLSVLKDAWHQFPGHPGGITGMVLLAESHIAVHTWPELGAVTLDIYVCNYTTDNSEKAEGVLETLLRHFNPASCSVNRLHRGGD